MEWLKKVSEDGRAGSDFFAWWKPGLNAECFLGRALARMWTDIRWRNPINESKREAMQYAAGSLETAFKLEPDLSYPWAEWSEILKFLELKDPEIDFVHSRAGDAAKIGYRRRNIRVTLSGHWVLKVPGSFSEFEAHEEGDFSAQDPPRAIWFTSYAFVDKHAELFQ